MVHGVMETLHSQGVLRTSDDAKRVAAYVIVRVSREDIVTGAENMFKTFTSRGVLGAFPGHGGVAGAYLMRVLRGIVEPAPEDMGDFEILLRDATMMILEHYRIPKDYVPPSALVREGIALFVYLDEIVRRLSEHEEAAPGVVSGLLKHEALHLIHAGKSMEDAYLLPDVTVNSVVGAFKAPEGPWGVPARKS